MMTKRSRIVVAGVAMIFVFGLLLTRHGSENQAGSLVVSYEGFTADRAGNLIAQFSVANGFPRRVRFGVCDVQIYETNVWPDWVRVTGGAAWIPVEAGGNRLFSVPAPTREQAYWRVPLVYQQDLSLIDDVRFRLDGLAWSVSRWRPGRPVPVRHGDGFHRNLIAYGPEMVGVSNVVPGQTEAELCLPGGNPSNSAE